MKISEIIAEVDELKPNTYDNSVMIRWLSNLDGRIFKEIIMTHQHNLIKTEDGAYEEPKFNGYTTDDMEEELLVCEPYTDIYRHYLYAMIDYSNGETDRYQNSMIMYNNAYQEYANYYNRTVMPVQKPLKIF